MYMMAGTMTIPAKGPLANGYASRKESKIYQNEKFRRTLMVNMARLWSLSNKRNENRNQLILHTYSSSWFVVDQFPQLVKTSCGSPFHLLLSSCMLSYQHYLESKVHQLVSTGIYLMEQKQGLDEF